MYFDNIAVMFCFATVSFVGSKKKSTSVFKACSTKENPAFCHQIRAIDCKCL